MASESRPQERGSDRRSGNRSSWSDLSAEQLVEEYERLAEESPNSLAGDMAEQEIVRRFCAQVHEEPDGVVEYAVPSVGQIVTDPESNPRYGSGKVEITQGTARRSDEYEYKPGRTVASANPGQPPGAPVVLGKYVDVGDKEYAFPVTRLEW